MKNLSIFALLLCLLIFSCTKNEIKIDPNNLLIGTWNYAGYHDNASVYVRSLNFSNNPCYKFNSDGTLVERNYSGWCATPPVSYDNYDGTWIILNDKVIQINVGYWGGMKTYRLDINSVTHDSLSVEVIPME